MKPRVLDKKKGGSIMLMVLAGSGRLAPWPAFGTWVVVVALLVPLIRTHLGELAGLANWIRALAHGGEADSMPGRGEVVLAEIAAAVAALRRLWQQ